MSRLADSGLLDEPCPAQRHGLRFSSTFAYGPEEYDPQCQTCLARDMLSEHDHLHLHGEVCETPGLNGRPGQMVKCKCGGYHH